MLEDFARRNGLPNPTHFTDDGISGTRFDRPGFLAMMEEVEAGRVEAIVIKDMSRLGRDYLKVGQVMEILRQRGVRLIAINDGVDSLKGDDDFTPFRNIMNEFYARDTSRKIRSVFKSKGMSGKHLTGTVIYGYLWDEKREHWLVDEEAAAVVRHIFALAMEGYTSFVLEYALGWQNCMPAFTTIINNIYLLLIPVGVLIGMHTTDFREYSLTFIFYLIIVHAISGVLNKIMYISESFTQIDGSVERMDEILRIPVLPEKSTAATIENYGIAFRDVSFSYEADSQVKALSHVSFFADQGKVTAIVGPSGGGKSTIASLISRFYDVTDGSIQIGGVDIRDIPLDALMDKVSFVFQDTFLFKQSILDNIRMGNPDATEEQVIAAAKAARCHEFIEQLPNGYQTVIGSTGVHLSGGERQRIAIARAIVKDAPIIVLDEATAFSDPENEYLIQKAFEKLIQNKTVVMIAHRLSTIRNADQILIMEKGCLIESGTHDELLKKDGKYAQMWSSYTESINWKIGTGKAV